MRKPDMHEILKEALGIKVANCSTCHHIGSESDGNYPEFAISWEVCDKRPHMENLKGFPFKKDGVKCWEPEFWTSKFADLKTGKSEEVNRQMDKFYAAWKRATDTTEEDQR